MTEQWGVMMVKFDWGRQSIRDPSVTWMVNEGLGRSETKYSGVVYGGLVIITWKMKFHTIVWENADFLVMHLITGGWGGYQERLLKGKYRFLRESLPARTILALFISLSFDKFNKTKDQPTYSVYKK